MESQTVIAINACLETFIFDNTGDDNTIVELDTISDMGTKYCVCYAFEF